MSATEIFLIDANSLIAPYRQYYPFDLAPGFWIQIKESMESGKILAPRKVFDEIMAGGDELSVWIDAFKGKTIDHSAVLAWSDIKIADPWLIAIAIVGGYSVVTFERTSASPKKPKIPDICDHFGVKHCNLFQMMRSLGFLLRS